MRFIIFAALFPPLAALVFMSPDAIAKGLPPSDTALAWLVASYPIAIVPALIIAAVDRLLMKQPLRLVKTTAVGGAMSTLLTLFLGGGTAELWPLVMVFLVGALPAALCSWVADKIMRRQAAAGPATPSGGGMDGMDF